MNKLRVFEAFSGTGMQRMALNRLGIDYVSVGTSEIDIPAINSYAAVHDGLLENETFEYPSKEEMIKYLEDRNIGLDFKTGKVKVPKQLERLKQTYKAAVLSKCFGDISIINPHDLPDMDLFTYSFPCTDLSVAGQMKGMEKGGTRSGLLYECEKVIEAKKPKYLLLENVKNLVGKKFKNQFDEWLDYLSSLGYTNQWQVINAKEFGVPQNRERVFVVSVLGEQSEFNFPKAFGCDKTLRDVLEDSVEEKYYIETERANQLIKKLYENGHLKDDITPCDSTLKNPKGLTISNCIISRYDAGIQNQQSTGVAVCEKILKDNVCIDDTVGYDDVRVYDGHTPTLRAERNGLKVMSTNRLGGLFDTEDRKRQAGAVWDVDSLSPTLDTMQGGYREPCVIDPNIVIGSTQSNAYVKNTKELKINVVGSLEGKHEQSNRVYSEDGICPTIMAGERKLCTGGYVSPKFLHMDKVLNSYRIRKLTPLECWRLMGIDDDDFKKAQQVNSNSQLYKQAGNGIVVDVLYYIFQELFCK